MSIVVNTDKNNERVKIKLNYYKEETEIRVESIKIQINNICEKLKNKLKEMKNEGVK